jgi:hypothetical protein
MRMDPRRWKFGGGVWVIVGMAALAVVLVLVIMMVPRAEVAARVNGEKILAEDVAEFQARHGIVDADQALDHLITERLLLQEATKGGHLPTLEDVEFELNTQLAMAGMTREDLEAQLGLHDMSYEDYLEGLRKSMAIRRYLEHTIEITEEEARARYDEYAELHGDSLPPFDQVKQQIVAELQQEALPSLIERLREEANIKYG